MTITGVQKINGSLKTNRFFNEILPLWRPAAFRDFRKKKRLNARGFALEFLQSSMLYSSGAQPFMIQDLLFK